jgi:hypothetical protein
MSISSVFLGIVKGLRFLVVELDNCFDFIIGIPTEGSLKGKSNLSFP